MDIILFECFIVVCFIIQTFTTPHPEWLHDHLRHQSDFKGILGIFGGLILIGVFYKTLFGNIEVLIANIIVMIVIALFFFNYSKTIVGFSDKLLLLAIPLLLECLGIIYSTIILNIQPEYMVLNRILFTQVYNLFLLSLGIVYLSGTKIKLFPLLIDHGIPIKSIFSGILVLLLLLLNAVIFISISGGSAIVLSPMESEKLFPWLVQLFNLAFNEELVFRLFLFAIVYRLFDDDQIGAVVGICLSSLIWALQHYFMDYNSLKFVMILTNGLFLGYLMKKYGLEICIIVHFLYNVLALTVLGRIYQ